MGMWFLHHTHIMAMECLSTVPMDLASALGAWVLCSPSSYYLWPSASSFGVRVGAGAIMVSMAHGAGIGAKVASRRCLKSGTNGRTKSPQGVGSNLKKRKNNII